MPDAADLVAAPGPSSLQNTVHLGGDGGPGAARAGPGAGSGAQPDGAHDAPKAPPAGGGEDADGSEHFDSGGWSGLAGSRVDGTDGSAAGDARLTARGDIAGAGAEVGGDGSRSRSSSAAGRAWTGRTQSRKPRWYGTRKFGGLYYLRDIEVTGRLIVIEGPDASGRSTQIEMLTALLEAEGYAVLNTGLTRSELIGQGILEAKRNVSLGMRTLALFYAADFADQLEHKIIPALQAGYVVLADRYIYTLMARNTVRGIRRSWSSNLYSFALVPDMNFYLDVDPHVLVHRVFEKRQSLDYYESGADMGISMNMYESFITYQQRLAREFGVLKQKYGLDIVDGNRSVDAINADLRRQILRYLSRA